MTNEKDHIVIPLQTVNGQRKWLKPAILVGLVIILAIYPPLFANPYILHILILTFVYAAVSVSLRTITISGQFPMGHGAFMGIGAYAAAMASKWLGWSPWLTIPLGAFAAGGIGMLFGYPFSRLRSLYYAMGSLFLGVAIISLIQAGSKITGGYSGLTGLPALFSGTSKVPFYYFFLALSLAVIMALYRFEFSRIGVNTKAVAQSYLVATSIGINEAWYRILAVGVGCFFAGLMGAAYGFYYGTLTTNSFTLSATFWLLMYVLIGGINSFAGPLIGIVILYLLPQFFNLKEYAPYLIVAIMVVVAYVMPTGIVGLYNTILVKYFRRKDLEKNRGNPWYSKLKD